MKLNEQSGKFLIYAAAIVIAFIIISKVFGGLDAFLTMLGLKDSADKTKAKNSIDGANSNAANSPFNPNLWTNAPAGTTIFTSAAANSLATQIYNSNGYIYDTPEQAEGAFKQCDSKVKVSQVCDAFNALYNLDCFEWMKRTFDTSSQTVILASIVQYCNGLKTY